MRKEARIRQHLSRAGAVASEAYERMVEERRVLTRVRLELESLRILLQRINRREKFKRDGELRIAEPFYGCSPALWQKSVGPKTPRWA